MKTLVVNFFAGAGAGKSTTMAGVFERLKWSGVEVEVAPEFAKDLVWEERFDALKDQYYVFGEQHRRITRLIGKVDVVLTDSPLILSAIYKPAHISNDFTKVVIQAHNHFDTVNYFIERVKPYNPKGRVQNEKEAREFDQKVHKFLATNLIAFTSVPGVPESVDRIANYLTNRVKEG